MNPCMSMATSATAGAASLLSLGCSHRPHPHLCLKHPSLYPYSISSTTKSHPRLLLHTPPHPTLLLTTLSSSSDPHLTNPSPTPRFLSSQSLAKSQTLTNFHYTTKIKGGSLSVRAMGDDEIDATVLLLTESFAESMSVPRGFLGFLGFLVKQYIRERRALLPHAATLIGLFAGEDGSEELAGTVEITFDVFGANASPPTPNPPLHSPYIYNMAVRKTLRRRGIGWNLLQASEQLISEMAASREVYLHCRIIDTVPFNMYKKAGYSVVKTDSILTLFTLQRRKHLMCKKLPQSNNLQNINFDTGDQPNLSRLT